MTAVASTAWRNRWQDGLLYGGLGLPLAFVALPLYVLLPDHYARQFGMPLTSLAGVLLGARLLDAFTDPLIGRWVDAWLNRSPASAWWAAWPAAVALLLGFWALFFPPIALTGSAAGLLAWCAGALVVTYLGFSVLTVLHQAWGARLGGDEVQRVRIVAWREGLALVGVLVASVLPSMTNLSVMVACFGVLLAVALGALGRGPRPEAAPATAPGLWREDLGRPWRNPGFLRLLPVFLLNGIAMAMPANLMLFFVQDRLQAPTQVPLFLAAYFAAAALSTPIWSALVRRLGLVRCWALGMALSVVAFLGTAWLGAGDVVAFTVVCLFSGIALGADLALPGALLAGVIQQAQHQQAEGAYFGWWNFATKLNLALAAGVSLPVLAWLGYAAGRQDPDALQALTAAYCVVPCLLKVGAGALLALWWRRPAAAMLPTSASSSSLSSSPVPPTETSP
ncbi:MAG: MFS transporter [Pseudomonadota bacterium]